MDGNELTPIVGPGDTGAHEDLVEPYRSMKFTWHIESNATAFMRRHGIRQAVIYTNMKPCPGEDGCDENVEATLLIGWRLTVFQVLPNSTVRVWDYPGTGEGLATDDPR